ncbi:hypothetical protein ACQPW1_24125 [Nocardia sp. CA-128927]
MTNGPTASLASRRDAFGSLGARVNPCATLHGNAALNGAPDK